MIKQPTGIGRQWPESLLPQIKTVYSLPQIKRRAGFEKINQQWVCQRCQQIATAQLPDGRYYCRGCLLFGRLVQGDWLYYVPTTDQSVAPIKTPILTWQGQLTHHQKRASDRICQVIAQQQTHCLTAVTGAGKTEMLFAGIAFALQQQQRVCLAAPRIDVCLELYPRLRAAFANQKIMLMYGQQSAPFEDTALVICTTHQLLKFYRAFDTLIIDEVDAFPFVDDPILASGVQQACQPQCARLYLTATPTKALQQAIQSQQMTASELPLRYHGQLLPEPQCRVTRNWQQRLKQRRLPRCFLRDCTQALKHQRLLIFVPQIKDLMLVKAALARAFPTEQVLTVHASDPQRQTKITAFREMTTNIMLATTVLERGVTFQNVAVLILGADQPVFKAATLVQMAGRAGRQKATADNPVYFYYQDYTVAIRHACQQIKQQNRRGRVLQCDV